MRTNKITWHFLALGLVSALPVTSLGAPRTHESEAVRPDETEWRCPVGLRLTSVDARDALIANIGTVPFFGDAAIGRAYSIGAEGTPILAITSEDAAFGGGWAEASTPFVARADSLPDRMPLRARLLWGPRGLVRLAGLAPSTRAGELRLRRNMLQLHQKMGLVTLAALTTQVVLGELIAKDRVEHDNLRPFHKGLGYGAFGVYMATASLSLFAPPGRRYDAGFSSIKLHRWLALVHFTGMMAQPFLGRSLVQADSPEQYDDRLMRHQWVGRITLGALATAMFSTFLAY